MKTATNAFLLAFLAGLAASIWLGAEIAPCARHLQLPLVIALVLAPIGIATIVDEIVRDLRGEK